MLEREKILSLAESDAPLLLFEEIDSTNNYAKELIRRGEAVHGSLVLSDFQSAGRGRHGHDFYSPKGSGLYLTILLDQDQKKTELPTIAAAVAVQRAIRECSGKVCGIKWVNDLFYNGKKVCGILAEALQAQHSWIIIGIGINCTDQAFPPELADIAGSLDIREEERSVLAGMLWKELDRAVSLPKEELLPEYREASLLLGKEITFRENDVLYSGKAIEIDEEGRLLVETEEGIRVLDSGEVSVRSWQ